MAEITGTAPKTAAALRALRDEAGISLQQAADAVGLGRPGYRHYETDYKKPHLPLDFCQKLMPLFKRGGVGQARLLALAGVDLDALEEGILVPGLADSDLVRYHPQVAGGDEQAAAVGANGGAEPGDTEVRLVQALYPGRANADLWIVRGRALELAGYLPGDLVVVDLDRTPAPGDVVCAQVYDWTAETAQTILRIYDPPWLVTHSPSPAHRKPELLDGERVVIKGVAVASLRRTA